MKNVISCLYTVLYCTGMCISEALSLNLADVSLVEHTVLVTESKNGIQRLLHISESLSLKCDIYQNAATAISIFFNSGSEVHNGQINTNTAYRYFRKLIEEAGILHRGKVYGPRLHDLRDTFVVIFMADRATGRGHVNQNFGFFQFPVSSALKQTAAPSLPEISVWQEYVLFLLMLLMKTPFTWKPTSRLKRFI